MNLQETLTNALVSYGLLAVFVSVLISAIGLPLPTSFLLLFAGSTVANGDLEFLPVVAAGAGGAIIGDHIGYGIGWIGGRSFVLSLAQKFKGESLLEKAEATSRKWGGPSIFLSRWLITAVGPYINLTSGITRYRLPPFSIWVILGEVLWVLIYVGIGSLFSSSIAEISDALGDFVWVLLGLIAVCILGYKVFQSMRKPAS
jgi:membrane protein DedA with SNARE-associated domain